MKKSLIDLPEFWFSNPQIWFSCTPEEDTMIDDMFGHLLNPYQPIDIEDKSFQELLQPQRNLDNHIELQDI